MTNDQWGSEACPERSWGSGMGWKAAEPQPFGKLTGRPAASRLHGHSSLVIRLVTGLDEVADGAQFLFAGDGVAFVVLAPFDG